MIDPVTLKRKVDLKIIGFLEKLEGRVPRDEEIREHGQMLIFPDSSTVFQWKGKRAITFNVDPIAMTLETVYSEDFDLPKV